MSEIKERNQFLEKDNEDHFDVLYFRFSAQQKEMSEIKERNQFLEKDNEDFYSKMEKLKAQVCTWQNVINEWYERQQSIENNDFARIEFAQYSYCKINLCKTCRVYNAPR